MARERNGGDRKGGKDEGRVGDGGKEERGKRDGGREEEERKRGEEEERGRREGDRGVLRHTLLPCRPQHIIYLFTFAQFRSITQWSSNFSGTRSKYTNLWNIDTSSWVQASGRRGVEWEGPVMLPFDGELVLIFRPRHFLFGGVFQNRHL